MTLWRRAVLSSPTFDVFIRWVQCPAGYATVGAMRAMRSSKTLSIIKEDAKFLTGHLPGPINDDNAFWAAVASDTAVGSALHSIVASCKRSASRIYNISATAEKLALFAEKVLKLTVPALPLLRGLLRSFGSERKKRVEHSVTLSLQQLQQLGVELEKRLNASPANPTRTDAYTYMQYLCVALLVFVVPQRSQVGAPAHSMLLSLTVPVWCSRC